MTTTDHWQPRGDRPGGADVPVAPGNRDQLAAWNGEEGDSWAAHPQFYDAGVRNLHAPLMAAAAVRPADRVLDVGCGTGQCARDAARAATQGSALGIDLSQPMLRVARATAEREGLGNAAYVQGDGQIYPFDDAAFDVVVSRTGATFFADQVAGFTNLARALRPGGRLALVSWRSPAENEWIGSLAQALRPDAPAPHPPPDAPNPFRHADPEGTTAILTAAGFEQVRLRPLDAAMYFGRDADEGFPILADLLGWMVRDLSPTARETSLERLRRLLAEHQTADGVAMGCAAWLVTALRPQG